MMSLSCELRNVLDHKYTTYLILVPLTYWMMNNFSKRNVVIVISVLLAWSFAYTCSPSANLFVRVFESNIIMVALSI